MKKLFSEYRNRKFFTGAFSLIELQVALVILAVSVWAFAGLFRVYSLQTNYIEQENLPVSTYYVVSQTSRWLRQLGVPADIEQTAGQSPWKPPVDPPPSGSSSGAPVGIIGSWVTGTTHAKETGIDRALVFIAHAERNGNVTLNSVTYGGQAMTKVVERILSSGNPRIYVVAFILNDAGINAATDTTFTPIWSAAPAGYAYSSVFLQNVNQATLTGATAGNATSSGDTITTSAALATSAGDMVIDAATCSNTGSYIVNNGFTEALEPSISDAGAVVGYKSTTGIDETPSVTHSTSDGRQSLIGFVVAGTFVPPMQSGYNVQLNSLTKYFDTSRAVAEVILSSN